MSARAKGAAGVVYVALAVVLALSLWALPAAAPRQAHGATSPPADPPNIVVVMTDDQNLDDMAVMPETRRLIASQGASLERFYVPFPACCPSRASYFTGEYDHNNGVLSNRPGAPGGGYRGFLAHGDQHHYLPLWLHRAGYTTMQVGKFLNGYPLRRPGEVPPGWDRWFVPPGGDTYRMYGYKLNQNGRTVRYGSSARDYQTTVYRRIATRLIRDQASRPGPFYLNVAPAAPHNEHRPGRHGPLSVPPRPAPADVGTFAGKPLPRPPSFNQADVSDSPAWVRRRRLLSPRQVKRLARTYRTRQESLLSVDRLVADVVRTLESTDELQNTYIVFTSDNGYLLGQHRLTAKPNPYEETIHMPLLIRGPGIAPGDSSSAVTANVDLAPTLLDMAGASGEADRPLDGVSLLPLLTGRGSIPNRDVVIENLDNAGTMPVYSGLRTPDHMFVRYATGEEELYDTRADPYQLENLADQPAEKDTVRLFESRLERLRDCDGPACSEPATLP